MIYKQTKKDKETIMKTTKILILTLLTIMVSALVFAEENCANCGKHTGNANSRQVASVEQKGGNVNEKQTVSTVKLPGYGKKVLLDKNTWYTYGFTKKTKIGANTLKVNIMDKAKKSVNTYQVLVSYDMPSMKGMHAQNDVPMQVNRAGNYLLPLNFVMPGVWQVDLKFMQGKTVVSKGSFLLKI